MSGMSLLRGSARRLRWLPARIEEVDEEEADQEEASQSTESFVEMGKPRSRRRQTLHEITVYNLLVLLASFTLFLLSLRSPRCPSIAIEEEEEEASQHSTVLDDMGLPLYSTLLNGSHPPGATPPPWRLEPGPEADAAWEQIGRERPIALTSAQVAKLGKDPSTAAKFDDSVWGLGDGAYIGTLEVFHQIRCLDVLRKEAFADYGRGRAASDDVPQRAERSKQHWHRMGQCTEVLMQSLLCRSAEPIAAAAAAAAANTDVLTYAWTEMERHPVPDLSTNKKCRSIDDLVRWRDEHAVDESKYEQYTKPPGVKEVPVSSMFQEILGDPDGDADSSTDRPHFESSSALEL